MKSPNLNVYYFLPKERREKYLSSGLFKKVATSLKESGINFIRCEIEDIFGQEHVLIFEPMIIDGMYMYVSDVWHKILCYHSPHTKLIVVEDRSNPLDEYGSYKDNYIDWLDFPENMSIFLENAKKTADYIPEVVPIPQISGLITIYPNPWYDNRMKYSIKEMMTDLYDGHNLNGISSLLDYSIQKIYPEIFLPKLDRCQFFWSEFLRRWKGYKKIFLEYLPLHSDIGEIENRIDKVQRMFFSYDLHNRTNLEQLYNEMKDLQSLFNQINTKYNYKEGECTNDDLRFVCLSCLSNHNININEL